MQTALRYRDNAAYRLAASVMLLPVIILCHGCDRGDPGDLEKVVLPGERPEPVETPAPDGPVASRDWVSPHTGMAFVWVESLGIWVGQYEVTNAEFRRMNPEHDSGSFRGHTLNGDRQPAVNVCFDDAREYAEWLNERDAAALGQARYRLPSEKEWLAVAQCGDEREFPWGDKWPPPSGSAGNYHGQEGFEDRERIAGYSDGHPVTAPVDDVWANPWGLHGLGGNVWEACAADETGLLFGALRGASWKNVFHATLRCAARHEAFAGQRENDYGFRLVLASP